MVGMNTIVIPLIIPGTDRGSVIFVNTLNEFAPRSLAAFITFSSIFEIQFYKGRTIKGRKL